MEDAVFKYSTMMTETFVKSEKSFYSLVLILFIKLLRKDMIYAHLLKRSRRPLDNISWAWVKDMHDCCKIKYSLFCEINVCNNFEVEMGLVLFVNTAKN